VSAVRASSSDRAWALLVSLYLGGILSANALAAKLLVVFGVSLTVGALAIPLVYLTTDLLNEMYGAKAARLVVWMGFIASAVLAGMSRLCVALPTSTLGVDSATFNAVFYATPRIVLASMTAYLVSSLIDVRLFAWIRHLTNGKHFWLRKNGSTFASQLVDSYLFCFGAFAWVIPWGPLAVMALGQYLVKVSMAPLGTPLSYVVLKLARRAA